MYNIREHFQCQTLYCVLYVFDKVKVWRIRWLICTLHLLFCKLILDFLRSVNKSVILYKAHTVVYILYVGVENFDVRVGREPILL
jgi:hypothetical protein